MNIGIVGSGKVGRALGTWAACLDNKVMFTSKTSAHAIEAAKQAGHNAEAVEFPQLIENSDLILLTLPYGEIKKALEPVREGLEGKILIDVSNPITPDHLDLTIGHRDSGAETIARENPRALIVKAFNAVFAEVYQSQKPQRDGHKISILYCGDDSKAKSRVRDLISQYGFDPVDAGPLKNARYLEPMSLMNIHLGRALGFGTNIGFALLRGT